MLNSFQLAKLLIFINSLIFFKAFHIFVLEKIFIVFLINFNFALLIFEKKKKKFFYLLFLFYFGHCFYPS